MWVSFNLAQREDGRLVANGYQEDGDDATVILPEKVSTPDFISFLATKAKLTLDELALKSNIKVNMRAADFQAWVLKPSESVNARSDHPEGLTRIMENILRLQEQQLQQQQQFMSFMELSRDPSRYRQEVKPDLFDGTTSSPVAWIQFYEYACSNNHWITDSDRINNLRVYLSGNAKKWYELRMAENANKPWADWRASFIRAFDLNPVERWDQAIFFKHKEGTLVDYFYEKRRLLQLADPNLPESSIVPLIIHGMTKAVQRQVLPRAPTTAEELLHALRDVCVDLLPPIGQTRQYDTARNAILSVGTPSGAHQPKNE